MQARRINMLKKSGVVLAMIIIGVLGRLGAVQSTAVGQQASVAKPQANVTLGEGEVKKLLLLMETDSDGKVSKQVFMNFMEAEFDRLDQKKEGKLDVKELTQPSTRSFHK
jgi:Ca2+-binding EF-hand superfamily protein